LPDADGPVDRVRQGERLAAAVREAGAQALSTFRKPLRSWTKGESSPVCEADIAADCLLHERLTAQPPHYAWLSEESADDAVRLDARVVWIVDPIDGTRAYIAGNPEWTVAAALVGDGRPVAACVYAPASEEFFFAVAGQGATLNGAPICATGGPGLADARVSGPKRMIERLAAIAPTVVAMPRVPSLALRLTRVAHSALDVAIAGGNSHDWDLAAADLLVHEAGGLLTPFGGGTLIYNRPEPRHGALVAAGRARHATLIDLVANRQIAVA
jgi:myo-inositol-1(or 4)-monophosphatase